MLKRFRFLMLLITSVVVSYSLGWSTMNLKYGSLRIQPVLGLDVSYDSNIYLAESEEKTSMITSLNPVLNLYLPVDTHEFKLNYLANLISYSENSDKNNAFNNTINFMAKLNFPVGLTLNLRDDYLGTTDPATIENADRTRRNQNTVSIGAGYKFNSNISALVQYTNVYHEYVQSIYKQSHDRKEPETSLELGYNVSPKTALLVNYAVGTIDYSYASNNNSSQYTQIAVGARGELTPKTIGEVKIGSMDKKYNDVDKDVNTASFSLSTITDFTDRTKLSLVANRGFVESTYADNLYYLSNLINFRVSQKIYKSWTGGFNGWYELNDYPNETTQNAVTEKRQDSYVKAGLDVSYSVEGLDWLILGGGYTMSMRDSNFDVFDYTDNVIGVNAKILF